MSLFESFLSQFQKAFIVDNRWKIFLKGFINTMVITLAAAAIGILIGVVIAVFRYMASQKDPRKKRTFGSVVIGVIDRLMAAYVAVIRGTPLAIQLMIMAFIVLRGVSDGMVVAIVAFGLNSGAYVSEVIRAGIQSVDGGQMEAGRSLGLNRVDAMRLIILPQALKNILPALCNEAIAVLKETSIVGLIAVVDLTRASDLVRSRTMQPYFPLLAVALIYFLLVYGLSSGVSKLEKRLARSDRG
ncbi:MAG: amino acid ABC transporter permease [Monoglobales bacterium]|jgi:His/Glu/Gln/Arg/opine family amino acid ABC transporter permease subunit|uniref:ABC transporter permease subunit n=1 Tax=Candidatus Ventrimonas sp. TaxID=3048889 RepID=UPI0015B261D5